MRRLFSPHLGAVNDVLSLDKSASHHARVLRLQVGEAVQLFDGEGGTAKASLVALDGDRVDVRIESVEHDARASDYASVTLVQAMPKGEKLDSIMRMATELGVDAIRLLSSERTVIQLDKERGASRLARLQRIASEASRQSSQSRVPEIVTPTTLDELVRVIPLDATHLLFVPDAVEHVAEALARESKIARAVWVWVGPEGGFSPHEVETLAQSGALPVRMFESVLRVETAAPIALALVLHALRGRR